MVRVNLFDGDECRRWRRGHMAQSVSKFKLPSRKARERDGCARSGAREKDGCARSSAREKDTREREQRSESRQADSAPNPPHRAAFQRRVEWNNIPWSKGKTNIDISQARTTASRIKKKEEEGESVKRPNEDNESERDKERERLQREERSGK